MTACDVQRLFYMSFWKTESEDKYLYFLFMYYIEKVVTSEV